MDILNVNQSKDESLSSYVLRFTSETPRIKYSNDELICLAFQNRLPVGPLYTELCWHPLPLCTTC